MDNKPRQRTCMIAGRRGYVGGCAKRAFDAEGWRVIELTRSPSAEEMREARAIDFRLGEVVAAEQLRGADVLVHCAYDFSLREWERIVAVNVEGTERLFSAAKDAGVGRRVFVSSISAYEGCKSLYGKSKLETERRLKGTGALLLRPALIYGDEPGGIFGNVTERVGKLSILPVFGGGSQILYMTHESDLCRVMLDFATGKFDEPDGPVTVAHERGWTFRLLLKEIGKAQGRKLQLVSVPWHPMWLALKVAEIVGLRLKFRSDSLLSLMHQNLAPSFELQRKLGLKFREFDATKLRFPGRSRRRWWL